jgi:hypothetical protein
MGGRRSKGMMQCVRASVRVRASNNKKKRETDVGLVVLWVFACCKRSSCVLESRDGLDAHTGGGGGGGGGWLDSLDGDG